MARAAPATSAPRRTPLTRERILRAAVRLADKEGIGAVSMRRLGQQFGVDPMSFYNHVANKDDLLDGMVDRIVAEIEPPAEGVGWKEALRRRILSARQVLLRHPWASSVIVTRTTMTPTVMAYMDSTGGILRRGGFSVELTHHAFHVLGSRVLGFSQELYDDSAALEASPEIQAMMEALSAQYPYMTEVARQISHDAEILGTGCDDQAEFEFALDLILDGLERMRRRQPAAARA
jgi:AcrR family transcriptional regulator